MIKSPTINIFALINANGNLCGIFSKGDMFMFMLNYTKS